MTDISKTLLLPDIAPLPPLALNLAAADQIMTCGRAGLRAYAEAGGLNPASDLRGLDLRGWNLAGQDLAGFDLSGCDLRGTGIEFARIAADTRLEGAAWDDGIQPGGSVEKAALTRADLRAMLKVAEALYEKGETRDLALAGRALLPLLTSLFGSDDPDILLLAGYVGYGEVRESDPAGGRARLQDVIDRLKASGAKDTDRRVLLWRFYSAEALIALDRGVEALAELDTLVSLEESAFGRSSPETLATRHLRARALLNVGRSEDALAEFEALLPLQESVNGDRHEETLKTRVRRAEALLDVGRATDALAELEALLPLTQAAPGENSPLNLLARHDRARALLDLGRTAEAFREFDTLLPLDESVRGVGSIGALTTRYLRARSLMELHRPDEALMELQIVKHGYESLKGGDHWLSLAVLSDEIGCRMALGEWGFVDPLSSLIDRLGEVLFTHNFNILRARYRLARALIAAGRPEDARARINESLALCGIPGVAEYRYVKAARRLLAGLDGQDDGVGLLY